MTTNLIDDQLLMTAKDAAEEAAKAIDEQQGTYPPTDNLALALRSLETATLLLKEWRRRNSFDAVLG